ncbi:SH3 domain-containing protein [Pedobacter hartonius]|uniref:SH3 domain-containing protein n=1 Tax=Pedobacter hartonius TaxID=425514 RepID=A0A1H4F7S1_9SPHI|nr:SH3 domain-containing protein [Pedobacter hartonius]SEA92542.1 SH3 domain-containing protein [Pedobacter hartonius]
MVKNLLFLILLFANLQVGNAQDLYHVTTTKLNVRINEDPKSHILGYIPKGQNIAVLDSSNSQFFRVRVTNGIGYVNRAYIEKNTVVSPQPARNNKAYNEKILGFTALSMILIIGIYYLFNRDTRKYALTSLLTLLIGFVGYYFYTRFIVTTEVKGIYVNTRGGIYHSFDFKGENTVMVTDGLVGLQFASGYILDGKIIRITSNQGDILLNIQNEKTLTGEGFSAGEYKRKD